MSQPRNVQLGIQQGSILGPQLFSLYVNDLPSSVKNGRVMMYADDTMILYSATSGTEIQSRLNEDLHNVSHWLKENRLVLNTSKTKYMIIGTSQRLANVEPVELQVDNTRLERVTFFKYLGVFLDQSLVWNDHLEYISKKIGSKISLLRRLRPFLSEHCSKLLANSLIMPHFDYCSPV